MNDLTTQMRSEKQNLDTQQENPHTLDPTEETDKFAALSDEIADITNTIDKTSIHVHAKEMAIHKLNATQLDSLQSKTTPLNIQRFKEIRDKYEICLNQIRTFLMEVENMHGKHTAMDKSLRTIAYLWSKMAFFKGVWYKVKVVS